MTTTNDIALEIANELRPVVLRLARELRRETLQHGITARQATLLLLVSRSPGISPTDVAADEGISPPSLSAHVDRLERLGLLERIRDQDDRRRVGLRLTPEGTALLRRVRAARTAWLAERVARLDDDDREHIARALPALQRLIETDA